MSVGLHPSNAEASLGAQRVDDGPSSHSRAGQSDLDCRGSAPPGNMDGRDDNAFVPRGGTGPKPVDTEQGRNEAEAMGPSGPGSTTRPSMGVGTGRKETEGQAGDNTAVPEDRSTSL
jgi:hypothetical protein